MLCGAFHDIAKNLPQHCQQFSGVKRCGQLTILGYRFLSEAQQKKYTNVTPDVRFAEPTLICGYLCWWLEFKNFFGFRANPFLASQNEKQLRKYAAQIGPGAVVYKLGFETVHMNIEDVNILREEEMLMSLATQDYSGNITRSCDLAKASLKLFIASSADEISFSRLNHQGGEHIDGKDLAEKKAKPHKSTQNKSQQTINAPPMNNQIKRPKIDNTSSKVTKGYRITDKYKRSRCFSKDDKKSLTRNAMAPCALSAASY